MVPKINDKLSKHSIKFDVIISNEKNQRPKSTKINDPEFRLKLNKLMLLIIDNRKITSEK